MTHGGPAAKTLHIFKAVHMQKAGRKKSKEKKTQRKKKKKKNVANFPNSLNSAANLNVSPDLLFRFLRSSSWFRGGMSLEGEKKDH